MSLGDVITFRAFATKMERERTKNLRPKVSDNLSFLWKINVIQSVQSPIKFGIFPNITEGIQLFPNVNRHLRAFLNITENLLKYSEYYRRLWKTARAELLCWVTLPMSDGSAV